MSQLIDTEPRSDDELQTPKRRRRRWIAAAAVVCVAAAALSALALSSGDRAAKATRPAAPATAEVQRGNLVDEETLSGTLGYFGRRTITAGAAGVVTALPAAGTRRRRGQSLYEIDGRATAFLLYGRRPAWRALRAGQRGQDVRQLEENLRALGYDPYGAMTVDDYFGSATASALKRFEDARGLEENGVLGLGEAVFLPARARVAELKAHLGQRLTPGAPVLATSGSRAGVTVALDADRQGLMRRGQRVQVELPDGRLVEGRVSSVGRVAEQPPSDEEGVPKVTVRIRLARRLTGLDQAPVGVHVRRTIARRRLIVPISALLAAPGGGYQLEVVDSGRRRLLPVRTGGFAGGSVEVEGRGLRVGMRVAVAR